MAKLNPGDIATREIDLIDLVLALVTNKRLFIGVFVSVFVPGLIAIHFWHETRYEVRTSIFLGASLNGHEVLPEAFFQTAVFRIRHEIIPEMLAQMRAEFDYWLIQEPRIDLRRNLSIVHLTSNATQNGKEATRNFHRLLAAEILDTLEKNITYLNVDAGTDLIRLRTHLLRAEQQSQAENATMPGGRATQSISSEKWEIGVQDDDPDLVAFRFRAEQLQEALNSARPKPLVVGQVGDEPLGFGRLTYVFLLFCAAFSVALGATLLAILYENIRNRAIEGA